MHNPERDARRYRNRAHGFRLMATEETTKPTEREGYLQLATAYDDVAGRLDLIASEIRALAIGGPSQTA